jgi:hypothetical protein
MTRSRDLSIQHPCAHKYYETKENGERLKPADFHKQWFIRRRDLPPLDPLLLVRDPLKIRDRPGKRQLSFFERIDIDLTNATTHASQKKIHAKLLQSKISQFFKPPGTTITNINTFTLSLSPKKKQLSYFRLQDKLQREPTSKEILKQAFCNNPPDCYKDCYKARARGHGGQNAEDTVVTG